MGHLISLSLITLNALPSCLDEREKLNNIKIGIPFDEFLNKSTNMLTVFAIFNALIAYALTLKSIDNDVSFMLFFSFYGKSILVWFRIMVPIF